MNIEKDLYIDIDDLHNEWLNQPILNNKYGQLLAEAKKELNIAKENKKTIKAELVLKAKLGGKELIGTSATVDATDAWVRTQSEYKESANAVAEAEYNVNMLESAVFSFQQRKSALENAVQLWRGSYYGEPRDFNMDEEIADEKANRQRRELNRGRK